MLKLEAIVGRFTTENLDVLYKWMNKAWAKSYFWVFRVIQQKDVEADFGQSIVNGAHFKNLFYLHLLHK